MAPNAGPSPHASRRDSRLARLQRSLEAGSRRSRSRRPLQNTLDGSRPPPEEVQDRSHSHRRKRESARKREASHNDEDGDDEGDGDDEIETRGRASITNPVGDVPAERGLRPRRNEISYKEVTMIPVVAASPVKERTIRKPPGIGEVIEVEVALKDQKIVWQTAVVRQCLPNGRFKACIDEDESFIEEFGMDDEGTEWRQRNGKYEGLKRQRRAVERLEVGVPRKTDLSSAVSTKVGPFRAPCGNRSRSRRTRHGQESDTMDSEEEFASRMKKSTARLSRGVQPLQGGGGLNGKDVPPLRALRIPANRPRDPEEYAEADQRQAEMHSEKRRDAARVHGPDSHSTEGDVQPMAIDSSIGWNQVGGLSRHVEALREMVLMPLLYPEVFDELGVTPPRGVLFHGPPGTGKTLVARALANNCSAAGRPVAFFMRKGADVLSKWVGEAEKQLRLLFQEAYRRQPSIIFFDEIDGLAPIRSSKQDQIHASIVSTLLALMDGLDSRGQVILIGATNRIDSLDAALRRPGRFDRELQFSLPSRAGRCEILKIHTASWKPSPPPQLLEELADRTHGFCGADLRALCSESALRALHSSYPEIFESTDKYLIEAGSVVIGRSHFEEALTVVTPAAYRAVSVTGAPLPGHVRPLLESSLSTVLSRLGNIFPPILESNLPLAAFRSSGASITTTVGGIAYPTVCRPHFLLCGAVGNGQSALCAAIMHSLEHCHRYSLELPNLVADGSRTPQEACTHVFAEARRTTPAVILITSVDTWLLDAEAIWYVLCVPVPMRCMRQNAA
ncbi:MAG: hypothetical protein SGPRY_014406 [Prymnesium sp.]